MTTTYDIAIIGGGIVGLATAMELTKRGKTSLVILEAEDQLAAHQTGHNSGVIHSGIYYKPGSLKARNCVSGRLAMYKFCEEHNIAHDNCGKLIVATQESEIPALDRLEQRGNENGLEGMRRLKAEEIKEYEPHTSGIAALHVPQTGIVDYIGVSETYAKLVKLAGGTIQTNSRVTAFHNGSDEFVLETPKGETTMKRLMTVFSGALLVASAYAAQTPAKPTPAQPPAAATTSNTPAVKKAVKKHKKAVTVAKPATGSATPAAAASPAPAPHSTAAKK